MKYLLKFYYNRVLYQKYCILLKNRRYFSYNKFITFVSLNCALKLSYIQCIQKNTSQFRDSIFDPSSPPKIHQRKKDTPLFLTKGRTSSWVITRYRRMVRIPGKRESLLIFENCATVEREKSLPRKKRDVSPCGKRKKEKKKIKRFFVLVMDVPWTRERRENR